MKPTFTLLTNLLNEHAASLTFMGYLLKMTYDNDDIVIKFESSRELTEHFVFPNELNTYGFNSALEKFRVWLEQVSEKSRILQKLSREELRVLGYDLP